MAAQRQYKLSPEAELKLRHLLRQGLSSNSGREFSNARFVRNTIERAIRKHAQRLFHNDSLSRDEAMTLTASDLEWEEAQP
ncbi:hypothetical protein LLE49_19785 [Alicyclobacillus tolerans]|uniref:hypothetical protein n=1 Tax=Alicyclobacillus tolerans TaxID=90970 RepID=UPI001F21E38E|nr:hypothetical protein [Alicyclobacillus tolerans]MCF8566965.1 hypothetical protein [Alicyclobacillus tolerans]